MNVFEAFPNAIEQWTLSAVAVDTATGLATASAVYTVEVVVDSEASVTRATDTTPAVVATSSLLYAKPSQLPTVDAQSYLSGYLWTSPEGRTFEISSAGAGKNQQTGEVEHLEFSINPVGSMA